MFPNRPGPCDRPHGRRQGDWALLEILGRVAPWSLAIHSVFTFNDRMVVQQMKMLKDMPAGYFCIFLNCLMLWWKILSFIVFFLCVSLDSISACGLTGTDRGRYQWGQSGEGQSGGNQSEIRGMCLQAKDCQPPPEAGRGRQEPLQRPCWSLELRLPASGPGREHLSIVLGPQV